MLEMPIPYEQVLRRALVRAIFAEIEAETYLMKQQALSRAGVAGVNFTTKQLAKLKDEKYNDEKCNPNSPVEAKPKTRYLSFTENIKWAFQALAQAYSVSYNLDVNSRGWTSLTEGSKVRNRLVHPKKAEDLVVADLELGAVIEAHDWFSTSVRLHPASVHLCS
ncbi:MAG: hypothetical protein NVS2B4_21780 [Ramlibacter sp.]